MDGNDLLLDLFSRIRAHVRDAVDGLDADALRSTVVPGTNPIGWLVWHLTRVQDDHVADLLDQPQVWMAEDRGPRFGITSDPGNTGYGHSPEDVARIRTDGSEALLEYYGAVADRTDELLRTITPTELDRIVDRRWDPPVTMGARLISVADDDIQHAGQAKYLRGLLEHR